MRRAARLQEQDPRAVPCLAASSLRHLPSPPPTTSGLLVRPSITFFSFLSASVMEESGARAAVVRRLLSAKAESGKTFSDLAAETGLTNVYVAQLKPETAPALRKALPALTDDLVDLMMQPPFRSYQPDIIQEPAIYRLNEAVMHFGESIKEIVNEEFGDGIMSAIDFYCSVDKVKGADGKDRVVVTFDGKYLPYTEQKSEHMMSRLNLKSS